MEDGTSFVKVIASAHELAQFLMVLPVLLLAVGRAVPYGPCSEIKRLVAPRADKGGFLAAENTLLVRGS